MDGTAAAERNHQVTEVDVTDIAKEAAKFALMSFGRSWRPIFDILVRTHLAVFVNSVLERQYFSTILTHNCDKSRCVDIGANEVNASVTEYQVRSPGMKTECLFIRSAIYLAPWAFGWATDWRLVVVDKRIDVERFIRVCP